MDHLQNASKDKLFEYVSKHVNVNDIQVVNLLIHLFNVDDTMKYYLLEETKKAGIYEKYKDQQLLFHEQKTLDEILELN